MQNAIHNIDTKVLQNATGEDVAVVVMGLDLLDPEGLDSFLPHVVEQFRNQRMCSPPTTRLMTVTIAGEVTALQFRQAWARHIGGDQVVQFFMSSMERADVLHIRGRELLDRDSLLDPR